MLCTPSTDSLLVKQVKKKETKVKNRGVLKQKGKRRTKEDKSTGKRHKHVLICRAFVRQNNRALWSYEGRGAELKEHLGTVFLWWESAALFSFAILTLAFGRPLEAADGLAQEADRMDKRVDKFLLAEREFCNPTSNASVL